ncbi:MAG TPA: hypothetical protein VFZ26_14250 [Gemmatimonadales bacterium]
MPFDPHHPHRIVETGPGDRAFVATFLAVFAGLTCALAALVRLTDPLAVFGTGLLPPVVSADRDFKATLYRAADPRPGIVVLGSSRVKTLRPACIESLAGAPAFNFGVNAGVAEDYVAIVRYLRREPRFAVREMLLGADPEAFTGEPGAGRALLASRLLGDHAPLIAATSLPLPVSAAADFLAWETVAAAFRSLRRHAFPGGELPQEAIGRDGWQTHPRWDAELAGGDFAQPARVRESVAAVSTRYRGGLRLTASRLALLDTLLHEARAAGVMVTAFIPPVHPELERSAGTLPGLTAEMVAVLERAERRGLLRYVRTSRAAGYSTDPGLYYDAVHMMARNGDRLLAWLYRGGEAACALQ